MIPTTQPANRFYKNNPLLKACGYQYSYTLEEIKEWVKCSKDPIYFIKTYIKVVNINRGFVNFDLYPFQQDLITKIHNNRKVVGMIGRQSGKSTTVSAYLVWAIIFNDDYTAAILANKAATAREIMQKCTKAYEALPFFLQQGIKTWNKGMIELENGSRILCAATTASAIRGYTVNCVKGDTKVCICDDEDRIFYTTMENIKNINNNVKFVEDKKTYYFVYKTTNLVNGKIYIGKHKTTNIDDGYIGSGKLLKKAIEKYGIHSFKREILEFFDTDEQCCLYENLLVTKEFCDREDTYNLSIGGPNCILYGENNGFYNKKHSEDAKEKMRNAAKTRDYTRKENTLFLDGILYKSINQATKCLNIKYKDIILKCGNPEFPTSRFVSEKKQEKAQLIYQKRKLFESLEPERKENFRQKCRERIKSKHTEEAKQKISSKLKGHKKDKKWVDKINKNPEKIEKTRLKHLGSTRSEESRKRMSEARKNYFKNGGTNVVCGKGSFYAFGPNKERKRCYSISDIPEGWTTCKS